MFVDGGKGKNSIKLMRRKNAVWYDAMRIQTVTSPPRRVFHFFFVANTELIKISWVQSGCCHNEFLESNPFAFTRKYYVRPHSYLHITAAGKLAEKPSERDDARKVLEVQQRTFTKTSSPLLLSVLLLINDSKPNGISSYYSRRPLRVECIKFAQFSNLHQ